jgi:hypothetical protein
MRCAKLLKNFPILLVILLFSSGCFESISAGNSLEPPIVTVIFGGPIFTVPELQAIMFEDLTFSIYNPNTVNITLVRIEYKIYFNGKFIGNETYEPHLVDPNIPPNQTKTFKVDLVINLSQIDEKTRNLIIEKRGEWNFSGSAYFTAPLGNLTAKVKKYIPEKYFPLSIYPSKITIEVEDEKWNRVEGANVTLISKENTFSSITDKAGKVEVEVPSTKYTLRIFKEGFLPYEETLDLSTPSNVGKIIQIYHAIKLKLEIADEKGNPIKDANVTFSSKDVGNFTKTTDASGIAEFEIPRADYTLSVKKKGYLPYEEVLDLSRFPIESKTIQLKPELTWLEQYWSYLLIGVIAICIIVPIVLRLKRRF